MITYKYKAMAQAAMNFPPAQLVRLRRWACCIWRPQIYRSDANLALAITRSQRCEFGLISCPRTRLFVEFVCVYASP